MQLYPHGMAPLFSVNKHNDSVNDGAVINFIIIQCTNQHGVFKVIYELQILRLYVCLYEVTDAVKWRLKVIQIVKVII